MKQYGKDGNVYDININNMSELELKPIPNIVNVDDIQSIIDTNKILQERIDRAIKYIKEHCLYEEEYDYDYEENSYLSGISDEVAKKELLSILEGDDKE